MASVSKLFWLACEALLEKTAMRIDLHTHSTASDGTDTPVELMEKAARENIGAIALTDHDTIFGLAAAGKRAAQLGLKFVRGCEISTEHKGKRVHMLGLWLPEKSRELDDFLKLRFEQRKRRNLQIIAKLNALGMDITLEEAAKKATGSIGRPHIGMVLVDKGYAANTREAFAIYLGDNGKAFVPKIAPTPHEAAAVLSGIGAKVFMAHPYFSGFGDDELLKLLKELKKEGMIGLEAWHSRHTLEQTRNLIKIARELGLAISGGSDYHGLVKPNVKLGCSSEGLDVPPQILADLENMTTRP